MRVCPYCFHNNELEVQYCNFCGAKLPAEQLATRMEKSHLDTVLEKLIIQAEYPSGVCLTDNKLIEYCLGQISQAERERIESHFKLCLQCQDGADELMDTSMRFDGSQEEIWAQLEADLDTHIADSLIFAYSAAMVPDTGEGRRLIGRIELHAKSCDYCLYRLEQGRELTNLLITIRFAELKDSVDRANLAVQLVKGLAELSRVRKVLKKRAMPAGYMRGLEGEKVFALVCDIDGKLELDDAGDPRVVEFGIIQAEIDKKGLFSLDLSTRDSSYWETEDRLYFLEVTLRYKGTQLILPSDKIHSEGRATISAPLNVDIEISEIPVDAIRLTVRPKATG
jgi:hypothetical protein